MQKENLEPLRRSNQREIYLKKLISYSKNEIRHSEFILKEDYRHSILQWRYKKKLDRLLEKLQNRM